MTRHDTPWPAGTPSWVDLTTSDPDRARAFYAAVLGWEHETSGDPTNGYTICRVDGAAAAGIGASMTPDSVDGWGLFFATTDVDATSAAVTAAGGTVTSGPLEIPGRGRFVTFVDPTGATYSGWQGDPFIGTEIVNEPGGLVWEDLRTDDPDSARAFLTAVFGHEHRPLGDDGPQDYTMMNLPGGDPLGGVGPLFSRPSPQWLLYFAVADIEAARTAARDNGALAVDDVQHTPFGLMSEVSDPGDARFVLMQVPTS